MSLESPCTYKVVIRHNVVVAVNAFPAVDGRKPDDDPLELSSQLASNNLRNGCLDGEYAVSDAEAARLFAHLSLDFLKRMIEKSLSSLDSGSISAGWINPYVPKKQGG